MKVITRNRKSEIMENEEIIEILDKLITYLKANEATREQDIAIQKLEESVFWLTYGTKD